ncbi:hypothetical protein ANN_12607 [Periplaneta americana]|uniref:Uncharacterized protein n=1 Tax=Periplaneta americana TaxID=6978 RepID=A0ABQ8TJ06_PERAM|nr:hypothetical protein ANN_12607 [Periplaneta americana]
MFLIMSEDLKTKVNDRILQDRRTSLDELLKDFLGGTRFGSDEELKKTVNTWLNELAAEEYNTGILKLCMESVPTQHYDALGDLRWIAKIRFRKPAVTPGEIIVLITRYVHSGPPLLRHVDVRPAAGWSVLALYGL